MPNRPNRRLVLASLAAISLAGRVSASGAQSSDGQWRLLQVRQAGCPLCAAWDRQVAPGYGQTPSGRRAPLMPVDIDGPWPDGLVLAARPRVTPSFVLLNRNVEIARMEGFSSPAAFHAELADMLRRGAG